MARVTVNRTAPRVVVVDADTAVLVASENSVSVVTKDQTSVANVSENTRVLNVAGIGLRGEKGEPGASVGEIVTASYESDHPGVLSRGMAVCLVNGKLRRSTSLPGFDKVIGLVYEDAITQGEAGRVQTDGNFITTALMWDDATGMVGGLAPMQRYFVTDTGAITPYPPTTAGQYIVPVGLALDGVTLRIELNATILL